MSRPDHRDRLPPFEKMRQPVRPWNPPRPRHKAPCRSGRTGRPKERFRSQHDATVTLTRMRASPNYVAMPHRELYVYECPDCEFWHVGTRAKYRKPPEET